MEKSKAQEKMKESTSLCPEMKGSGTPTSKQVGLASSTCCVMSGPVLRAVTQSLASQSNPVMYSTRVNSIFL